MRIRYNYVTWDSHLRTIKRIKSILEKYSQSYLYKEDLDCVIPSFKYALEFYFYGDSPSFDVLEKELSKFKLNPRVETEYEKAEIEAAQWFIIHTGDYQYPQPDDDSGYLDATFDLDNHCPLCGIGRVQNAPYRLRTEPKQYNNQFWGLHWDYDAIFVRQETKNILEREKIAGISFSNPVLNKKGTPIEGFYQLHIDTVLEKGFDNYNTNTITCKMNNEEDDNTDPDSIYCGSVKYHHPQIGGYLFDKDIFNSAFDIVKSGEYFGSGGGADRLLIVSKRFKALVEKNRLRGLSFTPIMHERFEK